MGKIIIERKAIWSVIDFRIIITKREHKQWLDIIFVLKKVAG